MTVRHLLLAVLVLSAVSCTAPAPPPAYDYDLALVGGRVVDGTGNPWVLADVGIRQGRIVVVGHVDRSRAARVVDVAGRVVAPGFIDVHAHIEDGIEAHPTAENFVRMGVTTLVTGN